MTAKLEGKSTTTAKKKSNKATKHDRPSLRAKLREAIKAGDKVGKPGQWSARKAQLPIHQYEVGPSNLTGSYINRQLHQ